MRKPHNFGYIKYYGDTTKGFMEIEICAFKYSSYSALHSHARESGGTCTHTHTTEEDVLKKPQRKGSPKNLKGRV